MARDFPDDWIDCPPASAIEPAGDFFACHKESPPAVTDFKTAFDRGLYADRDQCQCRGLSICQTVADVREITRRYPRVYRFVSKATLSAAHGMIEKTDGPVPSHHTFWKCRNLTFQQLFSEVV